MQQVERRRERAEKRAAAALTREDGAGAGDSGHIQRPVPPARQFGCGKLFDLGDPAIGLDEADTLRQSVVLTSDTGCSRALAHSSRL